MRGLLDRGRSKGSYFGGPPGHSSSSLTSIQGKLGPLTLGVDEEGWLEDEGSPEGNVSASGSSVTQGASAPTSSNTLSSLGSSSSGSSVFFWLVAAWVKSRAERPSVSVVNRQLHVQIGCKLGIRNRKDELEASKAKQITN